MKQRVVLTEGEEAAPVFWFFSIQSSRHLIGLTGLKSLLLEEVASGSASDAVLVIRMFLLRASQMRFIARPGEMH